MSKNKQAHCKTCGGSGYEYSEPMGTIDPCPSCNSGSTTEEICNEIWQLKQYGPHASWPKWRPKGWTQKDEKEMKRAMAKREAREDRSLEAMRRRSMITSKIEAKKAWAKVDKFLDSL
jgi:hypothetical protein